MRDEDLKTLLDQAFKIEEGENIMVIYSLDDAKHYLKVIQSSGYPMKILELHTKDNDSILATVFSYILGKRYMVAFKLEHMRSV